MSTDKEEEFWAYSWYSEMDDYQGPYNSRLAAIDEAIKERETQGMDCAEYSEVYLRRMEHVKPSSIYLIDDIHAKAEERLQEEDAEGTGDGLVLTSNAYQVLEEFLEEWAAEHVTIGAFRFVGSVEEIELPAPKEDL